jgi:hypothetical protein
MANKTPTSPAAERKAPGPIAEPWVTCVRCGAHQSPEIVTCGLCYLCASPVYFETVGGEKK